MVTVAADAVGVLADLAAAEARRHEPRTPERRAAAALWVALSTTAGVDSARRALAGFAARAVVDDAAALLVRLAVETTVSGDRR